MPARVSELPETETGYPVPGRPIMRFTWYTGAWFDVFELHTELIKSDLARAHAEGRVVVYLSCPISSRGGGHFATNVEIARHTARRLTEQWGERFFFLNPADYQLESRQGTGLITRHIAALQDKYPGLTLEKLLAQATPGGGDYMRMWSRVLIEDDYLADPRRQGRLLGGGFDAYYFLGPDDMREFFTGRAGGGSLTDHLDGYFTRRYAVDLQFHLDYATTAETLTADTLITGSLGGNTAGADSVDVDGVGVRGVNGDGGGRRWLDPLTAEDAVTFEARRRAFLVYYGTRAGTGFSLGGHDEWNIQHRLNQARRRDPAYGVGEEIGGFFSGRPLSLAETELETLPGYEVVEEVVGTAARSRTTAVTPAAVDPVAAAPAEVAWPYGTAPRPVTLRIATGHDHAAQEAAGVRRG